MKNEEQKGGREKEKQRRRGKKNERRLGFPLKAFSKIYLCWTFKTDVTLLYVKVLKTGAKFRI